MNSVPMHADEWPIDELTADAATLRRSKGAAIHQACAALPYYLDT